MSPWPKPINFTVRLGPNFLWHMLAVAKVGYDSPYAEKYHGTVIPDDLRTIQRHAQLLQFADGSGGGMSSFFTFLPGWLHLEERREFERYFQVLEKCFSVGDFKELPRAFPDVEWSDKSFRHIPEIAFPPDPEAVEILSDLSAAYLRSFDSYLEKVWPEAWPAMTSRQQELSSWFQCRDYIAAWEAETGIEFESVSYEFVMCFANQGGPDFNSLGYSGNLCYFDKPFERTWQFVSHEIGTHLLFDAIAHISEKHRFDDSAAYQAYEVMAMHYNRRILGLPTLAYNLAQYGDTKLLAFYEQALENDSSPVDLLVAALERFERDV